MKKRIIRVIRRLYVHFTSVMFTDEGNRSTIGDSIFQEFIHHVYALYGKK